jgi:hypothetical protein
MLIDLISVPPLSYFNSNILGSCPTSGRFSLWLTCCLCRVDCIEGSLGPGRARQTGLAEDTIVLKQP